MADIDVAESRAPEAGVVGRDRELTELDGFAARVHCESAVLALEGVPGIGKTTLWRAGVDRARRSGATVLTTRATEAEASLALIGLSDLFGVVEDAVLEALPDPQAESLAAALLRGPMPATGVDERALFASIVSVLRALTAAAPVVVAVDDAQWLDTVSARALAFAVRRTEHERVGFLVTVRDEGVPVASFDRSAEDRRRALPVGALSVGALHEVIKQHSGQSLGRPLAVRIAHVSEGNPLYALEIASQLSNGEAIGSDVPVPASLRALIAERVARLPERTQDQLVAAAALSRPTTDLLDVAALEPAEKAGVVNVADGRVHFVHPVFASAVYHSADPSTRRHVHNRLATTVTAPEERARHLALGSARPSAAIAMELDDAAVLVAARGAPDAAAELVDLAVRLTPDDDLDARVDRQVAGAGFRFDAGDLVGAETTLRAVIEDGARGPRRARALQLLGQIHGRRSNFADAVAAATEARAEVGDEDDVLATAIDLDLAYCCASLGDFATGRSHARAAVAGAEATGSETLPATLAGLTIVEFLGGQGLDEARLQRALELDSTTRPPVFMMRPRYIHGALLLWLGRCEESIAVLEEMRAELVERGEESAIPFLAPYLVWDALWRGDLELAERVVDEARDSAALGGDPAAEAIAAAFDALLHAYTGPLDTVRARADHALELFGGLQWVSGTIWPLWAIGLAALAAGDAEAVDHALGPLAQMITSMGPIDVSLGVFVPEEIEALVELGRIDEAAHLTAWIEERADTLDRPWARAVAGRCRGLVHAARGDGGGAVACLEDAVTRYDALDLPLERARTLLALGRVQRRRKQKRLARLALDEALSAFEAAGATLWSARVRNELTRVTTRRASETLTATEQDIARLATEGLTNRQIAERAFVSPKTVEANLARAYRKLGISSRAQLARALDGERT